MSHGLLCFVDGSYPPPTSIVTSSMGDSISNPDFHTRMRVDQSIRSWIFTALSYEVLIDVCDCPTSYHIWSPLNQCFIHSSMALALELKRMLTNIRKRDSQPMDTYLREIKTIADNLASVNKPVSQSDLVHYTLMGLGRNYETWLPLLLIFLSNLHLMILDHACSYKNNVLKCFVSPMISL